MVRKVKNLSKINIFILISIIAFISCGYWAFKAVSSSELTVSSLFSYAFLSAISFAVGLVTYLIEFDQREKLKEFNRLYQCPNTEHNECGLFIRKYQFVLYEAKFGVLKCPHCNTDMENDTKPFDTYDSFIDNSLEAPKINKLAMKDIMKSVHMLRKLRKEKESEQRFLDFHNKRKTSKTKELEWIKNIGALQQPEK